MASKIVQLEFNELCPSLMDRFIAQGHLPNFAAFRNQSRVFVTDAQEETVNLEPWIQWITVHTGLTYDEHGVFDLGDGHKLGAPRVWDLIGRQGKKVWICGSMNASFQKPIDGFILPDPWSTGIEPYPTGTFESFFHFVRANVQEHTRTKMVVSKADQLRFLKFMTLHGMSAATVTTIIRQLLVDERGGANRWKRAVILDCLQWDVFSWHWKRHQPAFSTFFLNSTAHFQHMYWRNMDPEIFEIKPSDSEQQEYGDAVLYGYQQMDAIVGKCLSLIDSDTTVIFASALSQQPCLKYEGKGGKVLYRPEKPSELFRFAGITTEPEYAPVMSEQFRLYFKTEAEATDGADKLLRLRLGDRRLMFVKSQGNEVFAGCTIGDKVESSAVVTNGDGVARPFYDLFYDCRVVKSGMHHPDGIFWVSTPDRKHSVEKEKLPLRAVAPTILALADCPVPEFMAAPLCQA